MNPDSVSPLRPDQRIADRYRLTALLGVGGAGMVYEAQDERSAGRLVALKFLIHLAQDLPQEAPLRFEREVRAGQIINHPAIVAVHDSGQHASIPFIVMERLVGDDLRRHLEQQGPVPLAHALRLTGELCAVVHTAHGSGVVHRDLKPANLWLTDGVGGPLKVLDFGVAKWMHATQALTGPGQRIGTTAYSAPELLLGGTEATQAADIYGIGACLFTMLSGRPPFVANSKVELMLMVANDPAPPLRTLCPKAPAALEAVLGRALDKRPQARHPSAAALAQELAALR